MHSGLKEKRRQERDSMKTRLVIDGNAVYEIDEECERKKMMDEQKRVEENHPTGKSGWNKDGAKVPLRRG